MKTDETAFDFDRDTAETTVRCPDCAGGSTVRMPIRFHDPTPSTTTFGERLYAFRIARRLSQAVAARKAGLARGYLSQIENSKRNPPPIDTIKRISSGLQLSPLEESVLVELADVERSHRFTLPSSVPTPIIRLMRRLTSLPNQLSPTSVAALQVIVNRETTM